MADATDDLRAALDRLLAAVPAHPDLPDGPPPDPVEVERWIERVQTVMAPLRATDELLWLWRTWDDHPFQWPLPMPGLSGASVAAEQWPVEVHEFGRPRCLLPVAYDSQTMAFVEVGTDGPGGPLWVGDLVDDPVERVAPSLASWVTAVAVASERYGRIGGDLSSSIGRDRPEELLVLATAEADLVAAGLGPRVIVDRSNRRTWLPSWLAADGIDPTTFVLRGATHTVADVLAAEGTGPFVATLRGRFRYRDGSAHAPQPCTVTDASGTLDVLRPRDLFADRPVGRRARVRGRRRGGRRRTTGRAADRRPRRVTVR